MEDNFKELKDSWHTAKKENQAINKSSMLKTVLKNHNKSRKAHIGNSIILGVVVIGLVLFFYFLAPMQEILSRMGIGLMIGGLLVRIVIELISYQKAGRINYTSTSEESIGQAQAFYTYRKKIHEPITITIIVLYTIGFYVLTPEFARYFSNFWMWMIDSSYLVIGSILFIVIRKGVKEEMKDLKRIEEIQNSLKEF